MVLASIFHRHGADEARLAHALRGVPIFRDIPTNDLVEVWRHLRVVEAEPGGVLGQLGDAGDRMFIVQSGSIEVRLGLGPDGMVLRRAGPGDVVGEMALLTGEARSADMVAAEPTVLWALARTDFESILGRSLPLARALTRSLAERLSLTTRMLQEHTGPRGIAGMRFGPYRVVEQIGVGGMAAVYSGAHVATGQAAALKVLPAGWGNAPELRARLQREAETLRGLRHPHVVEVLEVGDVDAALGGGCYIAMEWLPHAVDKVLRAQFPEPLAPGRTLAIAHDVALALDVVHRRGLVHRDIKPSNILLRADGMPVLTDFGLVTAVAENAAVAHLTPSNVVVGTADYLAPEVIEGSPADARSDVYSLGVTMYEMACGHVPFAGLAPLETLRAHREQQPAPLGESVPALLRAIVERAMAKSPERRYQSAAAMAEECAAAL